MVKNHLKRIATPKTWDILRKEQVFITKPNPGAHNHAFGTSLNTLMKEFLGMARTTKEVKRILHEQEVLVDGKRRRDERYCVGLMDVVTFPKLKKSYRVSFNKKGKLSAFEIPAKEADLKIVRINGKKVVKGGKTQVTTTDGRSILAKKEYKTGDSLLIKLPTQEIQAHLPLATGAAVIIHKGKYAGEEGTIEELGAEAVMVKTKNDTFHTKKSYAYVTGEKKPAIKTSP